MNSMSKLVMMATMLLAMLSITTLKLMLNLVLPRQKLGRVHQSLN